ncbi:hypothetical protein SEA_ATUIN_33 [Arthrobacter phage Atuin]|nr:hypothetical protein SEA_ATUIN_132 [Arthrobacter phage Atuin]
MKDQLIALAESIDSARLAANAIALTAPQSGVYGKLSDALLRTLAHITDDVDLSLSAYQAMLDGCTVREALKAISQ